MISFESFEASFRDFQETRSRLPSKIIRLRRISQENHVRRMKIAQQKKKLQVSFDASSLLSTSNQKTNSSNFRTPFSTPGDSHDIYSGPCRTEICKPNGILTQDNILSSIEYKARDKEYHSKFTSLKETESLSHSNKGYVESDTAIGDSHREKLPQNDSSNKERVKGSNSLSRSRCCLPGSNKMKQNSYSGHKEFQISVSGSIVFQATKGRQKSVKSITTSENTLDSASYVESKQCVSHQEKTTKNHAKGSKNDLYSLDSSGQIKNHGTPICQNPNSEIVSQKRCSSVSKIPIALSRLSIKEEKNGILFSDCVSKYGNNSESTASVFSNQGKVLNGSPWKKSTVRQNCQVVENNDRIPELSACDTKATSTSTLSISNEKCQPHTFDHQKGQEMSSVSKWLNSIASGIEVMKNSSGLNVLPHDEKMEPHSSNDNDSHEIEKYYNSSQIIEDFEGESEKDKYISESEQSVEYYDTEETEGEAFGSHKDTTEEDWGRILEDDASTIIIPSDKDLELETHRQETFSQLPDYPTTPYNLRYPRCMKKYDDSVLRSDGKEMDEILRQLKPIRIRKKTYSLTPKGRKSGKIKKNIKNRSQISRKKELFQ